MRIGGSSSKDDDFEINVISLIDIMLVLLLFFVMTATFENRSMMQVQLPEAATEPTGERAEGLTVTIDREGRFFVGANEVLNPGLDTLKAELEKAANGNYDQPVSLKADGEAKHQSVVTAMDALGKLGFSKLSIATVPTGPAKPDND